MEAYDYYGIIRIAPEDRQETADKIRLLHCLHSGSVVLIGGSVMMKVLDSCWCMTGSEDLLNLLEAACIQGPPHVIWMTGYTHHNLDVDLVIDDPDYYPKETY